MIRKEDMGDYYNEYEGENYGYNGYDVETERGTEYIPYNYVDRIVRAAQRGGMVEVKRIIEAEGKQLGTYEFQSKTDSYMLGYVKSGDIFMISVLLEAGADINGVYHAGMKKLLPMAIDNGHVDLVEFLLKNGANPNDGYYTSSLYPIELAVTYWDENAAEEMVRILIENKVNLLPRSTDVASPLTWAIRRNRMPIAHMIIEADNESALKVLTKKEITNIRETNASARRRPAIIAHALSRKMRRGSGRKKRKATRRSRKH